MSPEQQVLPYLINAFSVNQLAAFPAQVEFEELSCAQARSLLASGFVSAVGHEQTVALYQEQLGMQVPLQRISIALRKGTWAVLGQYRGPRLPEGAMELPEGASIQWYRVEVK